MLVLVLECIKSNNLRMISSKAASGIFGYVASKS